MNLLIIGAGGHGRCCYEIARRMKCFDIIDFVDDKAESVLDKKVIGTTDHLQLFHQKYDCAFIAIGNNQIRKEMTEICKQIGFSIVTLIDPCAFVSSFSRIGEGSVIFPNSTIEATAIIERGCIISSNTTVHHDTRIKEYSLIYSQCAIRPYSTVDELTLIPSGTIVEGGKISV